jgi:hypothetical protein
MTMMNHNSMIIVMNSNTLIWSIWLAGVFINGLHVKTALNRILSKQSSLKVGVFIDAKRAKTIIAGIREAQMCWCSIN